ncbi:PREDICTED: uncharacterized protein LOC106293781 [Brassica oleracea var. oleracea]|uniref:Uncharacterized protein n=1 Tax=Brassica oleracea var. oleracea TaxID=109376 RepID=A0A0D3CCE2_BRAOL|nr:PREDICTED: uncharacterized protein LOC106293781 [Brassica oleracea var. oleracea]
MFSLHDGILCSKKRDQIKDYGESFHGSFKRIKQEDQTPARLEKNSTLFDQRLKSDNARLIKPDVQLHLDTKFHSETFEDRKTYLDLELNLSSSSSSTIKTIVKKDESSKGKNLIMSPSKKRKSGDIKLSRSPSWLAFEGDDDQKKQEMVTTVCMKCHMLVMLCKSTLVCPNCKFTHPNTAPQKTFKSLSLFKLSY